MLTLSLGTLAAATACVMHDVIAALTVAYDLLVGALFIPIVTAMFIKRGSSRAALVSIILSALAVATLLPVYGIDSVVPIYVGLGISATVFLLGLADRRPRPCPPARDC
jgi:SSS family solute:Na+ symporter